MANVGIIMIASKRIEEKKEAKSYILLITSPITDDFHSQHPHAKSIISSWRGQHIGSINPNRSFAL